MKPAADTRTPASAPAPQDQAAHPAKNPPGTAPGYASTFPGRADQVSQVRREITDYLAGCPAASDITLIASELAANAILHGRSAGQTFTVRCHARPGQIRVEVEDAGGPWRTPQPGDRPHGLDIIAALTGPDGWGAQPAAAGGRVVWAELSW